jgi:N-acetyl sugar amidotransferase
MEYCARCVYPANAKPTIIFDDESVCSGCRYHESRQRINWDEREKMLREFLVEYKAKARESGNIYDCIIPVGGGKDSHFQTYLMKHVYGMNPLLVTYNHTFNTRLGIRNLNNLVAKLGVDLIRFTANPESVRKLSRYMLKTVGDLTWHYHAGIRTLPFQIAVKYGIPLIVWGEHGFAELTGLVTLEDMVEFTKWTRQEHDMRGYEPHELINEQSGITEQDIGPYVYPSDEEIEELDVRGIYLSNFYYWDALEQAKIMREKFDFGLHPGPREKSFILHGKTDDHANNVHDYLKYLKFGYGRATDDASTEIRHGRMSREEAIELVRIYDHVKPSTLETYLTFMQISEEEFFEWIDPMRDLEIWLKDTDGTWIARDWVGNHANDPHVEAAGVPLVPKEDRTFGGNNRGFYWRGQKTEVSVDAQVRSFNTSELDFIVL